jgi:hypothetical protein
MWWLWCFFSTQIVWMSHTGFLFYFWSPSEQNWQKKRQPSITSETLGKSLKKKCPNRVTQTHLGLEETKGYKREGGHTCMVLYDGWVGPGLLEGFANGWNFLNERWLDVIIVA